MFFIGIYGSIYGRTVNIHGTCPFHKLVLLWHCCENPILIVKCLNSCDDLQSSFSSKCRITHEILRVFTSISKAALNIFGGNSPQTLLKCQINSCCLDTLPPSCSSAVSESSISLHSACQWDTTRPLQSSSGLIFKHQGLRRLLLVPGSVFPSSLTCSCGASIVLTLSGMLGNALLFNIVGTDGERQFGVHSRPPSTFHCPCWFPLKYKEKTLSGRKLDSLETKWLEVIIVTRSYRLCRYNETVIS